MSTRKHNHALVWAAYDRLGNQASTARELGMSRSTVQHILSLGRPDDMTVEKATSQVKPLPAAVKAEDFVLSEELDDIQVVKVAIRELKSDEVIKDTDMRARCRIASTRWAEIRNLDIFRSKLRRVRKGNILIWCGGPEAMRTMDLLDTVERV